MKRELSFSGSVLGVLSTISLVTCVVAGAAAAAANNQGGQSDDVLSTHQQGTLEEITVTAQRRAENLQNVPIAVMALTASDLQGSGVASTEELFAAVPGLVMTKQSRNSQAFIRGVGSQSTIIGAENAVSTYVDGVYIMDTSASLFSFNNAERVEVLRGPQGTLFGRNATGGLINVITRDPTVERVVEGSVGYGNYATWEGSMYAAGGTDVLAADIAIYAIDQGEGFGQMLSTGMEINKRKETAVRTKILWTPTHYDRFTLSVDWSSDEGDIGFNTNAIPGSLLVGQVPFRGTIHDAQGDPTDIRKAVAMGGSLRYERELDWATLTALVAFRDSDFDQNFDNDAQPARLVDVFTRRKNSTSQEEIFLTGSTDHVDWTAGLFAFSASSRFDPLGIRSISPPANTDLFATQETESYAAYGQATYALSETINVTAGLRYTVDRRELSGRRIAATGHLASPGTVLQMSSTDVEFKRPTWRFSVDKQIAAGVMAYASYNRGFKSGVYNLTNITAPPVNPEILDAYEVGLKSELLDRQLRLNVAAFHYDYSDIQLTTLQQGVASFFNAAAGQIDGAEFEGVVAAMLMGGEITLGAKLAVLDAAYSSFPNGPVSLPLATGGNGTTFQDLSGFEMIRAPDWTLGLDAQYTIPLASHTLDLRASYYRSDGFFWEADNRLKQDPYDLLSAQLAITFGSANEYRLKVFGKNILNKNYYYSTAENALGDTGAAAPPRSYGIAFDFAF